MAKKKAGADPDRELVELEVKATFKTFGFRSLVNGDKLQIVFESDWNHLSEGTMDKVASLVQKVGTLTFIEAKVQRDTPPEDPTQQHLPLGEQDLGGKKK
jgi:hypothetical protein